MLSTKSQSLMYLIQLKILTNRYKSTNLNQI